MAERSVYVHLKARNTQYNAEMAKSGRITKMAMGVSERAIADNTKAIREMEKSATGLQDRLTKPIRPRVDASRAHREVETLEDRLNKLTFRKAVVTVAIAGLPVAVAGVAGLTAGLAGTAAAFGAAGAGAVAFGAVATQSLKRVTEAREELAKEGADRAAILGSLTDAQRQALRDVNQLADAWSRFQDRTDPAVLGAMGAAMQTLRAAMPALASLVAPVADGFEDLMHHIREGVRSGEFTSFTANLGRLSAGILTGLGTAAINAAQGVGHLVTAFSGLGAGMAGGLVGATHQFEQWAESLAGSSGFREFIAYVSRVGPQLVGTLSEVGEALLNIGQAAAPFAGPMLTVVSAVANLVNAVEDVHPMLLTAATGIGIFVAASRSLGSALTTSSQRMRVMKAEMAAFPMAAMKANVAMNHLGSAMGGKRGLAGAASIGTMALGGMADQSTGTGKALSTLSSTASGALLGFSVGGPIGAAIGGGAGLLLGLGQAFLGSADAADEASGANLDFTSTLNKVNGAVTRTTREMIAQRLEQKGLLQEMASIGLDPGLGVEAVLGDPVAIQRITAAFDDQIATIERRQNLLRSGPKDMTAATPAELARLDKLNAKHLELTRNKRDLLKQLKAMGVALTKDQKAFLRTTEATDGYSSSQRRAAGEARTLTQAVNAATRAQQRQAMQALLASDKNLAFGQAMLDAAAEARKGKKAWDQVTQAGIDNRSAVNRAIAAWNDLGAQQQNTGRRFENTRQRLIEMAVQMGASRAEARRYIDRLMEVPKRVQTEAQLDKRKAERDADILKEKFNDIPDPRNEAHFDTRDAIRTARTFAGTINGILGGIRDEPVNVELTGLAKLALEGAGPLMRAAGGPVFGPGSGTSDDIPAMLSNGEHVITAKEVEKAGGHDAIFAIRRMIRRGEMGDVPAFASGGPVGVEPNVSSSGMGAAAAVISAAFGRIADSIGDKLSARINEAFKFGGGRPLGPGGSLSAGQVVMGQRFAQAQTGKPYIWGGVGPAGYDCSGFQSAIYNAAIGRNPYSRLGSTGTMPWAGMSPGTGLYSIGWFTGSPGHMSGNIGGLNVESRGGDGVVVGSSARSPLDSMFNGVAHFAAGGSVSGPGSGRSDSVPAMLSDGEYVVNAKAVGRYGTAMFDSINAQRFADGGPVSKRERRERREARDIERALRQFRPESGRRDMRDELRELRRTLKDTLGRKSPIIDRADRIGDRMTKLAGRMAKLERAQEKATAQMRDLRQDRRALSNNVAANFRNDPFGGSLADFNLQVRADRNDARRMRRALREASRKGLDGALFRQLAESGNFLLARQFANLSRREIRQQERVFAERNQQSRRLGDLVGNRVYGERIRENTREMRDLNQNMRHLNRRMDRLDKDLTHAVKEGTREGNRSGGARQRARSR